MTAAAAALKSGRSWVLGGDRKSGNPRPKRRSTRTAKPAPQAWVGTCACLFRSLRR